MLEDSLPKEIMDSLPYEVIDISFEAVSAGAGYLPIVAVYMELMNGHKKGLYTYRFSKQEKQMIVDAKNFDVKVKALESKFKEIQPFLSHGSEFKKPRKPIEIAKKLLSTLILSMPEDVAMDTTKVITGYKNAPQLSKADKFSNFMRVKLNNTQKRK